MSAPVASFPNDRCHDCKHKLSLVCLIKGEPICEFFPVDTKLDADSFCDLMSRCELRIRYLMRSEPECECCPFGVGNEQPQLAKDCPVMFALENGFIKTRGRRIG